MSAGLTTGAASDPHDARRDTGSDYLLIGDNPLSGRVCSALAESDSRVVHLSRPGDGALAEALATRPSGVAITVPDDVAALRYALAIAHLDPAVPLVVTIFDRTIAQRVTELLQQVTVISPADAAVAALTAPCLGPEVEVEVSLDSEGHRYRIARPGSQPVTLPAPLGPFARSRSILSQAVIRLKSHDSHTQLLLVGIAGLAAVVGADWAWLTLISGHPPVEALLEAARVVATVGPGPEHVSTAYALFASVAMLATLMLTAIFTAGLVQRLLEPGLLGLFGSRRVPKSGHVIVVGMGQVGVRLCAELRRLGVPVVGVERNRHAPQLRVAHALKIPVIVGHGSDRQVLERLGLRRCRALAAVGSDELDNIAVAVAASAVSPCTPVVLRAGEQEAIAETRSLLPFGVTRDVLHIAEQAIVECMRASTRQLDSAPALRSSTRDAGDSTRRRACVHV